ncbi:MAG: hypothetical protein WCI67_17175, partial [Chloroflexales bacterium]
MSDLAIQDIGTPGAAGDSRGGAQVALVVIGDGEPGANVLPHYAINRQGAVSRLVAEERAGRGLGVADYQGLAQSIDAIAVSVLLQKRATAGYDGPLLRSLHALLDDLLARHGLDRSGVARLTIGPGGA